MARLLFQAWIAAAAMRMESSKPDPVMACWHTDHQSPERSEQSRIQGQPMNKKIKYCVFLAVVIGVVAATTTLYAQYWKFPPLPEPHLYGEILIDRTSTESNIKPVSFSHWSHRLKYTCRVCHFELDFAFSKNRTEITEEDNRNGLFCGACHDGVKVFGHTEENCEKCHTGKVRQDKERFTKIAATLPKGEYGNRIDWTRALNSGKIDPKYSLYFEDEKPLPFEKTLTLYSKWTLPIPPAFFPHKTHVQWLDCANCHPDIFNVKQRTTKHFTMDYILEKKFCGVCHLKVAFPIDDCMGCHPDIKNQ
ncbi:MAG: cytochrome c3 family protein [Desulfuromonadales bacterium]|nr:cytochrome c3 family protein [Desulfuromonadales bacterium]